MRRGRMPSWLRKTLWWAKLILIVTVVLGGMAALVAWRNAYEAKKVFSEPEARLECYAEVLIDTAPDAEAAFFIWSAVDQTRKEVRVTVPKSGGEFSRVPGFSYVIETYILERPQVGQPMCVWSRVIDGKLIYRVGTSLEQVFP